MKRKPLWFLSAIVRESTLAIVVFREGEERYVQRCRFTGGLNNDVLGKIVKVVEDYGVTDVVVEPSLAARVIARLRGVRLHQLSVQQAKACLLPGHPNPTHRELAEWLLEQDPLMRARIRAFKGSVRLEQGLGATVALLAADLGLAWLNTKSETGPTKRCWPSES